MDRELQREFHDSDDGWNAPPDDGGTGPGRPRRRRDLPPRRDGRRYLRFLGLGALVIAVERLSMLVLAWGGAPAALQLGAAIVFLSVVFGGTVVGGILFHRAWTRGHGPTP